ncbi:hypothetical protein M514_23191 [Trichuris suis]|uniref:Uncharacterized protein n=2 Tax=Trichuris suis TaxID=68888 RepID=A0A085LMI5_9BILA|nr:hypothetical protein M513_14090 [Trichuris suis]KFD46181.1 hypothetical protein M513_12955 [Trichuris suis]KFD64589.1 hypothetical protein M514_23191 [Trichuris suis]
MDVRDIEEFIDSAPEELTEDELLEMTGPEMLPGDGDKDMEEAVPENKLTLENLAKGFWLFRSAVDFFYDMDPSLLRPLKPKQIVEEGLLPYKNIFNEMKRQRSQTEITMYFPKIAADPETSCGGDSTSLTAGRAASANFSSSSGSRLSS